MTSLGVSLAMIGDSISRDLGLNAGVQDSVAPALEFPGNAMETPSSDCIADRQSLILVEALLNVLLEFILQQAQ